MRYPDRLDGLLPRFDSALSRIGLSLRRREYDVRLVAEPARRIIDAVTPWTMTDAGAIAGLIDAVDHISRVGIRGAFVECGVWRGGSAAAAALRLRENQDVRDLWLYDTFEGMIDPTDVDVRARDGMSAEHHFAESRKARPEARSDWFWAAATLEDVTSNLAMTAYPPERIHLVKGPVENTIPGSVPDRIALLRLDTDWHESTRHELEHLFPRLQPGGILIVDDYHYWRGSRTAVDEYFSKEGLRPFFSRIGISGAVIAQF